MAATAHPSHSTLEHAKELGTTTLKNWNEDNVPRLAAAFSFYAILSIAPLLVLAIVGASYFFEQSSVRGHLLEQVRGAVGTQGSDLLATLISKTEKPGASTWATALSLLVTFFTASSLFIQLRDTMNQMWGVPAPQNQPFWKSLILQRIPAFVAVLVFGALIVVWLAVDSWLGWLERQAPGFQGGPLVSLVASVLFLALVFAITYKEMPRGKVTWGDVWLGAFFSSVGVAVAKYLLGFYFAHAGIAGAYGPAGGLVVILLWIYYASQIFFFGGEVVYSYAHAFGSRREREDARAVSFS